MKSQSILGTAREKAKRSKKLEEKGMDLGQLFTIGYCRKKAEASIRKAFDCLYIFSDLDDEELEEKFCQLSGAHFENTPDWAYHAYAAYRFLQADGTEKIQDLPPNTSEIYRYLKNKGDLLDIWISNRNEREIANHAPKHFTAREIQKANEWMEWAVSHPNEEWVR